MRKVIYLPIIAMIVLGCSKEIMEPSTQASSTDDEFYASFDAMETKTSWSIEEDQSVKLYWSPNDTITIFTANTWNQPYKFTGTSSSRTGSFSKVPVSDFYTCTELSTNYAVYPYDKSTTISEDGLISMVLPTLQKYNGGSNPMVAVTANAGERQLQFKNLCGYLFVKLYGSVAVRSVTIRGNNNEVLSGPCTVSASSNADSALTMTGYVSSSPKYGAVSNNSIGMLGNSVEDATAVGFALPPVTFSDGFIMTVVDTEGRVFTKEVSGEKTITRNVVNTTDPIKVSFDGPSGFAAFDDANLEKLILDKYDVDGDGKINKSEVSGITTVSISNEDSDNQLEISSLGGMDFFSEMESISLRNIQSDALDFTDLVKLTSINISSASRVASVDCSNLPLLSSFTYIYINSSSQSVSSPLTSVDFNGCTSLKSIRCRHHHSLEEIDVSSNVNLTFLACNDNNLNTIDISKNPKLQYLECSNNQLTSLDLSHNLSLSTLYCYDNQLTSLDLSHNSSLISLKCNNNLLTALDVSSNTKIQSLNCGDNLLTALDLSNNTDITSLYCFDNQLSQLDVSSLSNLEQLYCSGNLLESMDLSNNSELSTLVCHSNQLGELDVTGNTRLIRLDCYDNELTTLDVSNSPMLTTADFAPMSTLETLYVRTGATIYKIYNSSYGRDPEYVPENTTIIEKGDAPTTIAFSDPKLKKLLFDNGLDGNGDGEINTFEALSLSNLYIQESMSLADLVYFPNLSYLALAAPVTDFSVSNVPNVKQLTLSDDDALGENPDLSNFSKLEEICISGELEYTLGQEGKNEYTGHGHLESIKLDGCVNLKTINVTGHPNLTELDVSECSKLVKLTAYWSGITSIDVTYNPKLETLYLAGNPIESIDLSQNDRLTWASFHDCKLNSIDISSNPLLETLWLSGSENKISSIDFSHSNLKELTCGSGYLESVDLSGLPALTKFSMWGASENVSTVNFTSNPEITYIDCNYDSLTSLDVSPCAKLETLICHHNKLTELDVSNNAALKYLDCTANEALANVWTYSGQTFTTLKYDDTVTSISVKP